MFDLISYIDVSDGKAGMLIPLFGATNTNLPYVQQMDEFFQVREIVPFLEYEYYPLITSEEKRSIAIGDSGLIAFRSFDGAVICGTPAEILEYIAKNRNAIAQDDFLQLQLHRIEGAELNPSYEVWRRVALKSFPESDQEAQRKFWVDAELSLFQKLKKIWSEIEPLEPETPKTGDSGIYTSISERSTEFLIQWLAKRANFISRDWTKIWHYVNERIPFDERTPEIALRWIFYIGTENFEFLQTKSVLHVLLDRWNNGTSLPDLAEFLSSKFAGDETMLFDFLRPKQMLADLLLFMAEEGSSEDLLKILRFVVDEVPKDIDTLDVLDHALGRLWDTEGAEPIRKELVEIGRKLDRALKHAKL
jgi:hypothetical protein